MKKNVAKQQSLFKNKLEKQHYNKDSSYGGDLLKTRKGRAIARPLAIKKTIHLVLRSSKANGAWSFRKKENMNSINQILGKFCSKYGIKILSKANVGNHLHLHIKLSSRFTYAPFIRAITSAIAIAITGASRVKPMKTLIEGKFWDTRPFTRILSSWREHLNLSEYIKLNQLEGCGCSRQEARYILAKEWDLKKGHNWWKSSLNS
ncbi:MAG: transposase [Bdellovibrionales bacterium]|nr:transposase [Bdellovibrionales bacterium]